MKLLITLFGAAVLLTVTGCVTEESDAGPQPIRPQGSGGRGESPGQRAETNAAVSKTDRM